MAKEKKINVIGMDVFQTAAVKRNYQNVKPLIKERKKMEEKIAELTKNLEIKKAQIAANDQHTGMITKEILQEYVRCVTKKRCNELKREIDARLAELEDDIAAFIALELPKIIKDENDYLKQNVQPLFNIQLEELEKSIKKLAIIPIATAGAAVGFGLLVANRLRDIFNSEIVQSYVTGSSFNELNDDYSARFNTFDRGLEADAETLGYSLGEQYERIIFR